MFDSIAAPAERRGRNPVVAFLLGLLFVGGGCWYVGRKRLGAVLSALFVLAPIGCAVAISQDPLPPLMVWGLPSYVALLSWLVGVLVAPIVARSAPASAPSTLATVAFAALHMLGAVGGNVVAADMLDLYRVPAGSMSPTLEVGDILVADPVLPDTELQRGQVVAFLFPGSDEVVYVKRLLAFPGETIAVVDGIVQIDGQPATQTPVGAATFVDDRCIAFEVERYTEELLGVRYDVYQGKADKMPDFGPYEVPAGHLFMMGDNRDHSADSRVWGPAPAENVVAIGRSVLVSSIQCDRDGESAGGIRFERLGLALAPERSLPAGH